MDNPRRNREITVNGWRIEPIGEWSAAPPEMVEDAIKRVVQAIESAADRPYHRSRHALTYMTQIPVGTGRAQELYIKTFHPARGLAAIKQMVRGDRVHNVLRITADLHRAGFATAPVLLKGVHAASGRIMLTSSRAEGVSLPEFIACGQGSLARKRVLLRQLGSEVARLHRTGLVHGDMTRATIFNADPAAQARAFVRQGFDYLHVVDLDGAFAGKPMNAEAVRGILAGLTVKLQLGGGIRDMKTVRGWLESGVTRAIIGTAAVLDPDFVREAARVYPGQIAVGIDARVGIVAIEGWAKTSDISALDLARRFQDVGVAAIIYTDIARDGALAGLNVESTIALADKLEIPVIASGGLASIEDIRRLTEPDCARLAGAIVGRALYDGRLDAHAALAVLRSAGAGGRPTPPTGLGQ